MRGLAPRVTNGPTFLFLLLLTPTLHHCACGNSSVGFGWANHVHLTAICSLIVNNFSFGQPSRPGGYVHNPAGDAGQAYVHDTTGDHGPYYYWKLRQQGKSGAAPTAPAAPAVQAAPAPQRQVVAVRKQRPAAQPAVFNNYQAAPAPQQYAQPAPAPQQYYQPAPAPVQQAAPAQNYWQGQADPFQINHGQRSYAYTAPTYSAQAQGTSYSYNAQY